MNKEIVPLERFAVYFSGFSAHAIEYEGVLYPTVEHAYHCLRYEDETIREEIRRAKSPYIAWQVSQKHKPAQLVGFSERKLTVMEALCRAKLEQHQDVRAALEDSGVLRIEKWITTDPPGDGFWDMGEGEGENHTGKIWMRLREEIRVQQD